LNGANYELAHAQYMQRIFTAMKKEDKTFEDLQLIWEEPLAKIGTVFGLQRSFDKGFDDYTSAVVDNINSEKAKLAAAKKDNEALTASVNDLKKTLEETKANLTAGKKENSKLIAATDSLKKAGELLARERNELTQKIASIETEKSQYKTKVDDQQKLKDQIDSITSLFLPSEAEVMRNGDLMVIRLVNMNFPANKASIDPQYYNLLAKVQKAIKIFPDASVVIEGHTDGAGDYQKNIETSQARAGAVFQYLLSTMGAESKNITVAGLGGSKPIANNNNEEGKAKNRRIEIVINPKVEKSK
jgi:OmpA-OmpF porin, OOP family